VPVINMLAAGAVRLVVVYLLVGNPAIGILGAPIGGILCYCAIAVLNLLAIRHLVPQRPALLTNLFRSFLPAAIMGAVVWACYWALQNLLHMTSRVILCGVPIAVGVVVYFVAVVLCKAITRADCQLLPKGDKIAKLLKL
jgi:stage V sporulation protein B